MKFCVTSMQLLVFWTKFRHSTFPSSQRRGRRDIKNNRSVPICRGRGGQFGTPSKASRTDTITASRYCARASRPSAPLLRLRPIGLALRALLCEEGNMTHSSSVQTATSSTFGCGSAALCLFVANHQRKAWPGRAPVGCPSLKTSVPLTNTYFSPLEGAGELNTMISAGIPRLKAPRSFRLKRAAGKPASF